MKLKNGQDTWGTGRCPMCFCLMDTSSSQQPAKFIDEKIVCLSCYPRAVDVYLADLRLKESERGTDTGRGTK